MIEMDRDLGADGSGNMYLSMGRRKREGYDRSYLEELKKAIAVEGRGEIVDM